MTFADLLALARRNPALVWFLIADLGLSAGFLSLALGALGGFAACYLCVAQRALLLGIAPAAIAAGVWIGRTPGLAAGVLTLALGAAGLAVAVFQSVVERRPGLSCDTPVAPGFLEAAVLRLETLSPTLFGVDGGCGAAQVALFGVSLANLGALAFAATLAAGVWALRRGGLQPHSE